MERDFLSMHDLDEHEIAMVFKTAASLKKKPIQGILRDKNLVLLFQKPSTRTMVSFDAGMSQLGGHSVHLSWNESQLGRGETVSDTAKVLSRYSDGIVARLFSHKDIEELARSADVPVINGLTDLLHPCQALSDMFTIREHFGHLKGLKLCFMGDGSSNVCHSLMNACKKVGMHMAVCCPDGHAPDKKILSDNADSVMVCSKPKEGLHKADVVYTDTWVSMGHEKQASRKSRALRPYQLNAGIMRLAKPDAIAMHCLPAHRGDEITSEVMDGQQSVVWDQAENRLHVQKALLAMVL
ncbi:MAG: ornithine carbamoyltransferase [Candidatus Aenigmatarchaeota archaeon]|nr:MAG: ornithine carbamoyltransferase [Candidatus Aenigmarchaeota archaeon]